MPASFSATFSSVTVSESIYSISTFTLLAYPPCLKLSATERYESSNLTYFPTIAIFTVSSPIFLISSIIFSHFLLLGSIFSNFKCLHTAVASPSSSSIKGTAYKLSAVKFCITHSFFTLQNSAIFSFISSGISCSLLQTKTSGFTPKDCNSFTEC